jgi:superfamily II DNA or RNA helicase
MKKLYDYQRRAVNSTKKNSKGIVCMPTGVGKTFCQASMIANDIKKNSGFRVYVMNAPRILLSYQLLKEVYSFLLESNITARYSFVHSGTKADETELENIRTKINEENGFKIGYSDIGATLNVMGIISMINKAKEQDLPLIFFSTYNSAEKIEVARKLAMKGENVAMVLNDEAHYLVQEQFHDILHLLKSDRCYFFTATMIHTPSDSGRGMNNEESYGKVLYEMLPVHAIRIGKMVRPRLHFVTTEGVYNTDDYNKSLNRIIADIFEQHTQVLKRTNQNPKLLISTRGTQDIIDFVTSSEYGQLRSKGVDVYVVSSSENIGSQINGEEVRRQEFLKRLKQDGEDKTKKMLVMHYDILAEGIDVSGFTGIMPLRTLNKSKFLQTYGRSARPDKDDRKNIDAVVKANGRMLSGDWNKMNKPYAYIIVPNITHTNEDDKENTVQLITELRNYGFKPYEDIIGSQIVKGEIDVEEPDITNQTTGVLKKVGVLIDRLVAELEAERLANMSDIELANELLK